MNIGTLTGIAMACLFASVVAVAAVIGFGGHGMAQGIPDMAVLASLAFVGIGRLIDRRQRGGDDHMRTSANNSAQEPDRGQDGPAR